LFGLILGVPLLGLAMGGMVPGSPLRHISPIVQALLATPIVLWCGWPLLVRAWDSLRHRSLNMFTLIGLGVMTAYLYSLFAVLAPEWFPEGFRMHGGVEPYFESAATITLLVLLGQLLEAR